MSRFLHLPTLILLLIYALPGCGPIPNDATGEPVNQDGIYVNQEWGFQISRPDSTWGLAAQVFELTRETNGLPQTEVWIYKSLQAGDPLFQPTLYLTPEPVTAGDTVDDFLTNLKAEHEIAFGPHTAGEKETVQQGADTIVEWQLQIPFSSRQNFMPGTRFLVTVVFHDGEAYVMLSNGESDTFPVETYRQIAASLAFL